MLLWTEKWSGVLLEVDNGSVGDCVDGADGVDGVDGGYSSFDMQFRLQFVRKKYKFMGNSV